MDDEEFIINSFNPYEGTSMNEIAAAIGNSSGGGGVQENIQETAMEVAIPGRRPRGRPMGSKNKPPETIVCVTRGPALQTHVMEITNGADIGESVTQFARSRELGLCILSGSGTVFNPILRVGHRSVPGELMPLPGPFHILYLRGSFVEAQALGSTGLRLSLCVATREGPAVGGVVDGPLWALGPVIITVATFSGANYERLGIEPAESTFQASPYIPPYNYNHSLNYWQN